MNTMHCRVSAPHAAAPRIRAAAARRASVVAQAQGGRPAQMLIFVPPHPLIKHWLAVCRNVGSPSPVFRSAMGELGRILIYEAGREWLPVVEGEVESPLGVAPCEVIDPAQPIKVVPVLRAGMLLLEDSATVLPHQQTFHVGVERDEDTLQPSWYLNKLPESFAPTDRVLVAETMIATGGTILLVLDEIVKRGADPTNVRVIAAVCAPPALQKLSEKYPGMKLYTAMIDEELNDKGLIVPGLGDAGDRGYGTE